MKCDCIEETNKTLAAFNLTLDTALTLSIRAGGSSEQIYIPTRPLEGRRKKKALTLFASFCPFCGEATGLKKREAA